jgi:DNA-binding XRE family transcriptional regulator
MSVRASSFSDIEARRAQHGLTRKAVYERARVHKETWRRLNQPGYTPSLRTLLKLSTALDLLIEERADGTR